MQPDCAIACTVCFFLQYYRAYDIVSVESISIWACTGFDGDVEVWEAIRRLRNCVKSRNLNIKADDNEYALAA